MPLCAAFSAANHAAAAGGDTELTRCTRASQYSAARIGERLPHGGKVLHVDRTDGSGKRTFMLSVFGFNATLTLAGLGA